MPDDYREYAGSNMYNKWIAEIEKLTRENKELLAACKRAEQTISRLAEDNEDRQLISDLRAAISKAGEK